MKSWPLRKIQHDLRLCASEPVDGLVIIPYDKKVIGRGCQQLYHIILDLVNILEFIYKYIPETLLP